jgi:outer membrane protein W
MKYIFISLIIFQFSNIFSSFAQSAVDKRYFIGVGFKQMGISNNIFDGKSSYISSGEHLIYPLPEFSNEFGFVISIGLERICRNNDISCVPLVMLFRYSRTIEKTSWSGPDFIDLKWSRLQTKAVINSFGLDWKFLLSNSGLKPYILAGLTYISMDVEKGAASYWEFGYPIKDIFADSFDSHYNLYDINAGFGLLINIFSSLSFDGNFTIKYQELMSVGKLKNIESSNGFAIEYSAGLIYCLY